MEEYIKLCSSKTPDIKEEIKDVQIITSADEV
jgi:hypothetical protein